MTVLLDSYDCSAPLAKFAVGEYPKNFVVVGDYLYRIITFALIVMNQFVTIFIARRMKFGNQSHWDAPFVGQKLDPTTVGPFVLGGGSRRTGVSLI
jgi:hypothetical protein